MLRRLKCVAKGSGHRISNFVISTYNKKENNKTSDISNNTAVIAISKGKANI
mgnify:CR=1 FL=1